MIKIEYFKLILPIQVILSKLKMHSGCYIFIFYQCINRLKIISLFKSNSPLCLSNKGHTTQRVYSKGGNQLSPSFICHPHIDKSYVLHSKSGRPYGSHSAQIRTNIAPGVSTQIIGNRLLAIRQRCTCASR